MSIRLSTKNGLNPCVAECYICGKSKNEIMLLGASGDRIAREQFNRADGRMPSQAVFDVVPCDECKANGIAFVEMSGDRREGKPTGRRWLLKEDAVRRLLDGSEVLEPTLAHRMCMIDAQTAKEIGLS